MQAQVPQAVALAPTDPDVHYNYGVFLKNVLNEYAQAESAFQSALESDPENVRRIREAYRRRGFKRSDLRKLEDEGRKVKERREKKAWDEKHTML